MPYNIYKDILTQNDFVVVILEQIDYLLKLRGQKSNYGYAAFKISQLSEPLFQLRNKFKKIDGIGKITAALISEIIDTGSSEMYEKLLYNQLTLSLLNQNVLQSKNIIMKSNQLYITNRNEWREWLKKNHNKINEIWLIYFKKHTGTPRIPYDDAVEEALCYGWIDSTVKRIDEETFMQKFTPRKKKSIWSKLNKKR